MINTNTMVYNPNKNFELTTIECPDIFSINDKIILIANLFVTSQWWIGSINQNVCLLFIMYVSILRKRIYVLFFCFVVFLEYI